MLHRFRRATAGRSRSLKGVVEIDETYLAITGRDDTSDRWLGGLDGPYKDGANSMSLDRHNGKEVTGTIYVSDSAIVDARRRPHEGQAIHGGSPALIGRTPRPSGARPSLATRLRIRPKRPDLERPLAGIASRTSPAHRC